ncbi:MAG: hypothetical protein RIR53_897 [Bacteroidota bacterium]|jgi:hypothetical protein
MASSRKTLVLRFNRKIAKRIIRAAQHLYSDGLAHGIRNIFQPGLIKEIIIADILGHRVISNKRLPDACSATDESVFYEYLTCEEGGSWQIDRMFSKPLEKRRTSLDRILRNEKLYLVSFKRDSLDVSVIFEVDPQVAAKEAERQLNASSNEISHISFSQSWTKVNGTVVWTK